jgi:hypothetical protein
MRPAQGVLHRFAAYAARSHVKEPSPMQGLRGTVSLRPLRKLGSLSAPRFGGDYFAAHAVRLTSVSAALERAED